MTPIPVGTLEGLRTIPSLYGSRLPTRLGLAELFWPRSSLRRNPPVCSARSRPAQAPKSNSNPSLTRRGMRPSLDVSPSRSSYCIDQAGRTCDTYRSIPSYVGRIHPSRGVILAASPPRGTSADSRFQVLMLPLQHADDRENALSPQTDFQYLN